MKLSISVPDDLWLTAAQAAKNDSPSAVVQEALTLLTRKVNDSPYRRRPDLDGDLERAVEEARATRREHLRELYADGYRRGSELATKLTWSQLREVLLMGGARKAANLMEHRLGELQRDNPEKTTWSDSDLRMPLGVLWSYLDYGWVEEIQTHRIQVQPEVSEGIDAALADFRDSVTGGR